MDKEELIAYLKENLEIKITRQMSLFQSDPIDFDIDLVLDKEVISSSTITVGGY